ncbi:aldehyde-activating protein, partial [Acinetobacter baumannii]|nr:aldehyde-activating protein [Acinetobacter baumannii]
MSYQSDAEPRYSFNCHCRDCQKATGSAYAP